MNLTIRNALPDDETVIVALGLACDGVVRYNDPAAAFVSARGAAPSDVLVGSDATGRPAGTVRVGHDGHRAWLYSVAADPMAQGSGIGRQMVTAGEDWLRQRGIAKVQLMVR